MRRLKREWDDVFSVEYRVKTGVRNLSNKQQQLAIEKGCAYVYACTERKEKQNRLGVSPLWMALEEMKGSARGFRGTAKVTPAQADPASSKGMVH